MSAPNWWQTLLLVAASFRIYRLLAEDTIFDRVRERALRYDRNGQPLDGFRAGWAEWLTCPWCSGAWVSAAWWAAWQVWPHATLVVAVPPAVSAAVGLIAKLDE